MIFAKSITENPMSDQEFLNHLWMACNAEFVNIVIVDMPKSVCLQQRVWDLFQDVMAILGKPVTTKKTVNDDGSIRYTLTST